MSKLSLMSAVALSVLRRLPAVLLIAVLTFIAFCVVSLFARQYQKHAGTGAVAAPGAPSSVYAEEPRTSGRFTANIDYTSIAAPKNGEVTSTVAWDDDWFVADSAAYNHELATTASVIAALAYAESGYYQAGNTQPAYMEDGLTKLGFDKISTASYQYRSEIVDEVLNLFTDESDTVAYAIARKRLRVSRDDTPRDLLLVSVRGSYGSEWLSNLNLMPEAAGEQDGIGGLEDARDPARGQASSHVVVRTAQRALSAAHGEVASFARPLTDALASWMSFVTSIAGRPQAEAGTAAPVVLDGTDDHSGYFRACEEICSELNRWVSASRNDGAEVVVLLTGHSRGGAIANLAAAELDDIMARSNGDADRSDTALSSISSVYAYTFASPATTVSEDAHNERYGNIFNIINPADVMPYLPLRAWGYERYGRNLYLPAVDDEGFARVYEDMCRSYTRTVGVESGYDPEDKRAIDRLVGDVSERIATAQDLMTPAGVAATVVSCATHIDPIRILYGHYPSTYIAWMEALSADGIVRE